MATERMRRINEVMREVIGTAISSELEDPRIGFVTITAVETSPDLRTAKVFFSVLGDEGEREATGAALGSAHGLLQAAVARETHMKRTPTLTFHYDVTPERGVRLAHLLEDEDPE
jgi:ribosome-binding factor A